MRSSRRVTDARCRKLIEEKLRRAHLRNIRINFSLNYEWDQLNWEIWVRLFEIHLLETSRSLFRRFVTNSAEVSAINIENERFEG